MRIYTGRRDPGGAVVEVDGRQLDPRLDLWNHSPTGFEWGCGGSGPAQLALAILADCLGDSAAKEVYQAFKFRVIGRLEHDGWTLTEEEVISAVDEIRSSPSIFADAHEGVVFLDEITRPDPLVSEALRRFIDEADKDSKR